MWVRSSGVAHLNSSFTFDRKKNSVEIEIRQDQGGGVQYVGPMVIRIQELDGAFHHTVQIEKNLTKITLSCHSKSRRNKKKKIPLLTGEEIDIDHSQTDQVSGHLIHLLVQFESINLLGFPYFVDPPRPRCQCYSSK